MNSNLEEGVEKRQDRPQDATLSSTLQFPKPKLKSASLNRTFLATTTSKQPTRTSTPQYVPTPIVPTKPVPAFGGSKLRLTTSKVQSSLKSISRENTPSPNFLERQRKSTDTPQSDVLPVWGKRETKVKATHTYTDEELQAMHGISMASRIPAAHTEGQNRWDDVCYSCLNCRD